MFTNTLQTQKNIVAVVMGVVIFFGVFATTSQAKAQTFDRQAMLSQIQQLMQIVTELQEQLLVKQRKQYEDMHQTKTNVIHGKSYIETTSKVTLYKEPNEERSVGKQSKGDGGNITGGPRLVAGEVWWKVAFEDGDEGWVMEKYLERIPSVGIYSDQDGDGTKELVKRIFGDYRAERFILFPLKDGAVPIYIEEDMDMLDMYDGAYVTGQTNKTVSGSPTILQSDPYTSAEPFIKGKSKSVPIAWEAKNVPMNSKVEVQVEALRLVDSPLSGGTWEAQLLVGNSIGRYFWNIEGEGRIGAGDYRSQVRVKVCTGNDCKVVTQSPYRYFSIRNPE